MSIFAAETIAPSEFTQEYLDTMKTWRQLTYLETCSLIDIVSAINVSSRNPLPIVGVSPMQPPNKNIFRMIEWLKEYGGEFVLDQTYVEEHLDIDCSKSAIFFCNHSFIDEHQRMYLYMKWSSEWAK